MNRPGPLIAEGATAEIFAWGDDAILKLYRSGFPPDEAQREADRVDAVRAAGIFTPAVLQAVEIEGRNGLVFQRARGSVMLDQMQADPERVDEMAQQMAELHAELHTRTASGLPRQHQRLRSQIERADFAPPELRAAALQRLEQLPQGQALCHGDFHPNNIILTETGPILIDWVDATEGSPAADVARTRLLMLHSVLPHTIDPQTRQQIESLRQRFFTLYWEHYQTLRGITAEEVAQWALPLAVARMSEGLGLAEKQALITLCQTLHDQNK